LWPMMSLVSKVDKSCQVEKELSVVP
jgi:hypothetical protein